MRCRTCRSNVEQLKNNKYICKFCCEIIDEVLDEYDTTMPEGEYWIIWSLGNGPVGLSVGSFAEASQTEGEKSVLIPLTEEQHASLCDLMVGVTFREECQKIVDTVDGYLITGWMKIPQWRIANKHVITGTENEN